MIANDPQIAELPDELADLANAACNCTLSAEQQDRLGQLLLDDESAQLAYVSYLNIHAQLHWSYRGGAPATASVPSDREHPTPRASRARRNRVWWAAASAVAAASVAIASLAWYDPHVPHESPVARVPIGPDEPPPQVEVAVAVCSNSSHDAVWETSDGSTISGPSSRDGRLLAGRHKLKSGVVEIEGKYVVHHLAETIPSTTPRNGDVLDEGTTKFTYRRTAVKKHMLTLIAEKPPEDQVLALGQLVSGATDYEISELTMRDLGITAAIATYISFS